MLYLLQSIKPSTYRWIFVMEDEHMYLVVEEDKLQEAIIDLIRIGLDIISGYITLLNYMQRKI